MRRARVTTLVLLTAAGALAPSRAHAQRTIRAVERPALAAGERSVDEVVVAVESGGEDPVPVFVLAREVLFALRFEQAFNGANAAALRTVPRAAAWRDAEELAAGEALLDRSARRSADPEPSPEELAAERAFLDEATRSAGGVLAVCSAAGLPLTEVDHAVRRRIVAARFLFAREPARMEPSDDDLRAEWRRGDPTAQPFAAARGRLRALLLRRGYARSVRGFVRALGTRLRMRRWANPLAGSDAAEVDNEPVSDAPAPATPSEGAGAATPPAEPSSR